MSSTSIQNGPALVSRAVLWFAAGGPAPGAGVLGSVDTWGGGRLARAQMFHFDTAAVASFLAAAEACTPPSE